MSETGWCAVVVVVAMLLVAPVATAKITVGQVAPMSADVTADACDTGTYAVTSTANPPRYEIPGDGVLTRWRTFATVLANVGPERLKVLHPVSASTFKVVATSDYANSWATVDNAEVWFPTRIAVVAGDLIGLGVGARAETQSMPHCFFGGGTGGQWMEKLGLDHPADSTAVLSWDAVGPNPSYRVSVSATLEPDLDHDGFGDETQDQCVTVAGTENGCPPAPPPVETPPPDNSPPAVISLSGLTVAPHSFPAAPRGPSARIAKRRYGAKVAFTLSTAGKARFSVTRSARGRRDAQGRCVAVTRINRGARSCTRAVAVPGSFSRAGGAGANSFRFMGRMHGRKLKPGKYRLIAVPSANAQTGISVSASFAIVR
jgi:hypothetical protein